METPKTEALSINWPNTIYKTYEDTQKEGEKGIRWVKLLDMDFAILPNVFAPDIFANSVHFAQNSSRIIKELRASGMKISSVCEIGCGSGLTATYLAKNDSGIISVVASDINPHAVENTKHNVTNLGLEEKVTVYESDCFDNIPDQEFDVVCWWMPYNPVPPPGNTVDPDLAKGGYDPGYSAFTKFIKQANYFLAPNGVIFLGIGSNVVNNKLLDEIIKAGGLVREREPLAEFHIPLQVGTNEPNITNQIIALRKLIKG